MFTVSPTFLLFLSSLLLLLTVSLINLYKYKIEYFIEWSMKTKLHNDHYHHNYCYYYLLTIIRHYYLLLFSFTKIILYITHFIFHLRIYSDYFHNNCYYLLHFRFLSLSFYICSSLQKYILLWLYLYDLYLTTKLNWLNWWSLSLILFGQLQWLLKELLLFALV